MILYSLRELPTGWAHLELHLELEGFVRTQRMDARSRGRKVRAVHEISYSAYNF